MVNYCPECGSKMKANFKFCPECGQNLVGITKFCSKCGEEIPLPKRKEDTKSKKVETKKEVKTKFTFPKVTLNIKRKIKRPSKKLLAVIIIIIVAVAACSYVYIFKPFNFSNIPSYGGRIFTVTVDNNCDSDAECYFTVEHLKYTGIGIQGDFEVTADGNVTYEINEDDLFAERSTYEITLICTIDGSMIQCTADDVTEIAMFSILSSDIDGTPYVNCTLSQ